MDIIVHVLIPIHLNFTYTVWNPSGSAVITVVCFLSLRCDFGLVAADPVLLTKAASLAPYSIVPNTARQKLRQVCRHYWCVWLARVSKLDFQRSLTSVSRTKLIFSCFCCHLSLLQFDYFFCCCCCLASYNLVPKALFVFNMPAGSGRGGAGWAGPGQQTPGQCCQNTILQESWSVLSRDTRRNGVFGGHFQRLHGSHVCFLAIWKRVLTKRRPCPAGVSTPGRPFWKRRSKRNIVHSFQLVIVNK